MSTTGPLVEGNLALDLVNTEEELWGVEHDYIGSPEAFCRWLTDEELAGAVTKVQLPFEVEVWSSDEVEQVHRFRDTVRADLMLVTKNQVVSATLLRRLERHVERAPLTMKLLEGRVVYVPTGSPVERLCSLVAADILRFIGAGELGRLRKCENPKCKFMFIDTSGRRKWCSMKRCGNRAKVTRYVKTKGQQNQQE